MSPKSAEDAQILVHLGGEVWAYQDLARLLVPAGDLLPHPNNPRNGDTEEIIWSIRLNHVYRPLYVQRSSRRILAGNHTYAAALEMGAERLPVVWLDCTDDEAERILLADNRLADLGKYDDGVLARLLQGVSEESGLAGTGYSEKDLEKLLADTEAAAQQPLDVDPPSLISRPGDVWLLGQNRLEVGEDGAELADALCRHFQVTVHRMPYLVSTGHPVSFL